MNFLIVSHVQHVLNNKGRVAGYAPYVKEMNLWLKYCDKVTIVAPLSNQPFSPIDLAYAHKNIDFVQVPSFQLTSKKELLKAIMKLPYIFMMVFKSMFRANHIHLRCPGNMGLIGAFVQILFPSKFKTAKYAGNWDWNSNQPWSYRWQQKILQNTFWTKNMQVLVYGNWPGATKNIKPFFTASYSQNEIENTPPRNLSSSPIKLIFVGGLTEGKQPLISVKVCEALLKHFPVELNVYGDGALRLEVENYIKVNNLENNVFLHGNKGADVVKKAYQQSHFLIFISKSEGWPKVVAESMFWGCLPITTAVSCVPEMVGNGSRGSIVKDNLDEIVNVILAYYNNEDDYVLKAQKAMDWSREFTLEKFESEIIVLLENE